MPRMLYTVTSRDTIFNGENDFEDMRKDSFCWYESDNRKESLEAFGSPKTFATMAS